MSNVPRIESAEVIVTCPGRNFVTLKRRTDQGITGVSDATLNGRELAVVAYLQEHVIPCLIGRDARRIEVPGKVMSRGSASISTRPLLQAIRINVRTFP